MRELKHNKQQMMVDIKKINTTRTSLVLRQTPPSQINRKVRQRCTTYYTSTPSNTKNRIETPIRRSIKLDRTYQSEESKLD